MWRRSPDEWLNRAEDWRMLALREASRPIRRLFFWLAEDYERLACHAALSQAADTPSAQPSLVPHDAL